MARMDDPAFKYLYHDDPSAKTVPMATLDGHTTPSARSESLASDRFTAALANVTEMGAIPRIAAANAREVGVRRRGNLCECICSLQTDTDAEGTRTENKSA